MSLRPLNDRILIRPHKSADETESGLQLPENRSDQYVQMHGTVIAVGPCAHPLRHEASTLATRLLQVSGQYAPDTAAPLRDAADLLLDVTRKLPCVKPGDDVLFSWNVGQEVTVDDDTFLLMREDDLLAVLED